MSHVLVEGGKVKTYPYSFSRLRADNPDTSYPDKPSDEMLAGHNVYPVVHVDAPAASAISKNVVEGQPKFVKGVWTQVWTEVDASPEEVTQREKDGAEAAAKATIKQDAFVANFIAMTPAQVEDYVNANVTNIASAKALLVKMAKMLLLLARREFS